MNASIHAPKQQWKQTQEDNFFPVPSYMDSEKQHGEQCRHFYFLPTILKHVLNFVLLTFFNVMQYFTDTVPGEAFPAWM